MKKAHEVTEEFRTELAALLKKYDAEMIVDVPERGGPTEVMFDIPPQWRWNAGTEREMIAEGTIVYLSGHETADTV